MMFHNFRSILITPATRVDLYSKGCLCKADIFMIDLEDSVPIQQKVHARQCFLDNMHKINNKKFSFRINSLNSIDGLRDLLFLIERNINVDYLLVPKIADPNELVLIRNLFASERFRVPKLISLIESSAAVANLDNIAKFSDALLFGGADYALDFGLPISESNQLYARQKVALYAHKYQIPAIDTPTFTIHDLTQLSFDCQQSKMLGFSGKLAVSKCQVTLINKIYQYSEDEINWAKKIVEVSSRTSEILMIDECMVGKPFYELAKLIIKTSEAKTKIYQNNE